MVLARLAAGSITGWALLAAATAPARAEGSAGDGELRYDPLISATLTVSSGLGWLATELIWKDQLAPDRCRWCAANGLDERVRDALLWDDVQAAHGTSNVTAFLLAPAVGYGALALASWHDDHIGNWITDGLIVTEAVVVASTFNQLVKFGVGRERPFVHALAPADKDGTADPAENNLSFYSGHTQLAFAFAASAGTVASMRRYRWAPLIWGAGGAFAIATGYLRVAADKPGFSDVVTGAVLGSAIGVATPYLLHRAGAGAARGVSVSSLAGGGAVVSLGGRW